MPDTKPETVAAYLEWLQSEHKVNRNFLSRHYYDSVSSAVQRSIDASAFWQSLVSDFSRIHQEYQLDSEYSLFISNSLPQLLIKPHRSFIEKTYRTNVVHNEEWDSSPRHGWLLPGNWFTKVHDVVRTQFVVKYLDGVDFLVNSIQEITHKYGMTYSVDYEAKEEGYYAAHAYTEFICEVPDVDWDTRIITVSLEIQITTQLQDVIRTLLHKHYEDRRMKSSDSSVKWQWDYTSDEFSTNYLGHILHYVEGMIMEIRERQKEVAP